MATVIDLSDWRGVNVKRKPLHGPGAKILLFTGVRFERLGEAQPQDGNLSEVGDGDQTLRNRAG